MPAIDAHAELIGQLLGDVVVAAERCRWGFSNQTTLVTMQSGHQVITQILAHPDRLPHLARVTHELPALLEPLGITTPRLIAVNPSHQPALLIRSYIPGEPANTMLDRPERAHLATTAMGQQLHLLQRLTDFPDWLDQTWADPHTLADQASQWLALCSPALADADITRLRNTITDLNNAWLVGRVLAHGDYCPVNVIVRNEQIVGLIDWEQTRIASPAFDAAWWGWVLRYHHPERWQQTWSSLLQAADLPSADELAPHMAGLQRLRCLEYVHTLRGTPGEAFWIERLRQTMQWED